MPLDLDDPRWANLATSYRRIRPTLEALKRAYASGMTDADLGEILNEVNHQGDITEALYAVAPHFVELALLHPCKIADEMIIHLGLIHADTSDLPETDCPDFLRDDFLASKAAGLQLLLRRLPGVSGFEDVKYCLNAIAGFLGEGRIARVLYDLDLHEAKLWLCGMDDPLENY